MTGLFDEEYDFKPLAERVRPKDLDGFYGQQHILASGQALRQMLDSGAPHSCIFWGPPGVGKTTLARLMALYVDADFISVSAVLSGVKEIRSAVEKAKANQGRGRRTILFIDEVHRFNKAQQDAFLPHLEDGTIIFVGATTENPSFELNNALLSRARVYILKALQDIELCSILKQALQSDDVFILDKVSSERLQFTDEALNLIANIADGDARRSLNLLELSCELFKADDYSAHDANETIIDAESLKPLLQNEPRRFDKNGDIFYEQISALHKSVRGSSPDGALYWFNRMLDGGCDPLYISRRVLRMASEDIGNADPRALSLCLDALSTYERLGSPEGELAIAQAIVFLAVAPKSDAVYSAFNASRALVSETGSIAVPKHLQNHGEDYRHAHDYEEAFVPGENYLPEELKDVSFYQASGRGLEAKIKEKMEHQNKLTRNSHWKRYT